MMARRKGDDSTESQWYYTVAESRREDHNDIHAKASPRRALFTRLGCWSLGGGVELSSVLDNGSNSYQIYPGAPLRLSQIDEHRDGSHPRSALSQSMSSLENSMFAATALAVFDRPKGHTLDNLRQHVCSAVRSSRQQLPFSTIVNLIVHHSPLSPGGLTSSSPRFSPHCVMQHLGKPGSPTHSAALLLSRCRASDTQASSVDHAQSDLLPGGHGWLRP
jgi:hypothetical protein